MKASLKLWDDAITSPETEKDTVLEKLATALWVEGNFDESIAVQLELCERLSDGGYPIDWLDAVWNAAWRLNHIKDRARAISLLEEAIPVAVEYRSDLNAGFLLLLKGQVEFESEFSQEARESLASAARFFVHDDNSEMLVETVLTQAEVSKKLGNPEQARLEMFEALSILDKDGKARRGLGVRLMIAEMSISMDAHEDALTMLTKTLTVARFLDDISATQRCFRMLGLCHSRLGNSESAEIMFLKAVELKEGDVQLRESARASRELALHNIRTGKAQIGRDQLVEAETVYAALGLASSPC